MTPAKGGRHCASCNKVVVDFTVMSEKEIKDYFLKNTSLKTCGRVYKAQLRKAEGRVEQLILDAYYRAAGNIKIKPVRIVVLFFLGAALTLSGCGPAMGELKEPQEK